MKRLFVVLVAGMVASVVSAARGDVVAWYTFEEGQGDVLRDHSGNGNHGKIPGGAKWVKGPWGTALEFDGKDDYVDFRAAGDTAALTVSDWKSEKDPGGPVGQELMFNFIEIQPYIGD